MMALRLPRIRSFRLRIAMMATGLALAAIGLLYVAASLNVVSKRSSILDRILLAHLSGPGFGASIPALWPAIDVHLNASFSGFAPDNSAEKYAILRVTDAEHGIVYQSGAWPDDLQVLRLPEGQRLHTLQGGGSEWRIGQVERGALLIHVGVNRSLSNAQLRATLSRFGVAVLALAALIGLLSWYLAGRAMRPIEHVTGVMLSIKASDLNQRVSAADEDVEFAQLVVVFNDMLERLQRSFLQAVRFSGDAAHELKTPLTILQGELERQFSHAADPDMQQALADMLDEVRRLDSIVRKLLLLSRADAGQLQVPMSSCDLRELLDELADDVGMLDEDRELRLELPPALPTVGDPDLLRQVLQNLVSNAMKYGTAGGWIAISAHRAGAAWHIDVANASDGIGAEHLDRLFDRFYRADAAHSRRVAGVGLGLSLSREIARAHGGELRLADPGPGKVCFRLTLPLATQA